MKDELNDLYPDSCSLRGRHLKMAAGGNGESSEKRHSGKVEITPGCQVWCKTHFNEEIQGIVTAYDRIHRVMFIKSLSTEKNAKPNSYDVNMVNLNHLPKANFKLISLSKGGPPNLPELDHGKIARRVRDAIIDKMKAADKVGINVSIEAQKLFDLMYNFYPDCHWDGDAIIVMNDVKIAPPYNSENCFGEKKESLERIRKKVEKFHSEKETETKS